jgi:hypothetical protein
MVKILDLPPHLLDAQRGDVATIRALWTIQDRLALSPEEGQAIELKRDFANGPKRVTCNPALSLPTKAFDFTEAETARILMALETWPEYGVATDRRWLEPLLNALMHGAELSQ